MHVICNLLAHYHVTLHWCRSKPRDDMAGLGIALPEPLLGEDAKSCFKRFKVCAAANE